MRERLTRALHTGLAWLGGSVIQIRRNIVVELAGALVFTVLASVGVLAWHRFRGVESYTVYVVGSASSRITSSVVRALESRVQKLGRPLLLNGVPVVFSALDDGGDAQRARDLAKSLAAADDTLMVIGHFSSTRSKQTLPVYLGADPPVPVVLPSETNPDILPADDADEYRPVYRLAPTDDQQAMLAADHLVSRGCQRILALDDSSLAKANNQVYTQYLINQFVERVEAHPAPIASPFVWAPDIRRLRLGRGGNLPGTCVFFVGGWSTALMVIRSMPQAEPRPAIILSDSAADPRLFARLPTNADGDGKGDAGPEVFLAYTMSARETDPFVAVGADVFAIVESLLTESTKAFARDERRWSRTSFWLNRLFGIHRVQAARFSIARSMERAVARRSVFRGARPLRFQYDGTRDGAGFYLWRLTPDGGFEDASAPLTAACERKKPDGAPQSTGVTGQLREPPFPG